MVKDKLFALELNFWHNILYQYFYIKLTRHKRQKTALLSTMRFFYFGGPPQSRTGHQRIMLTIYDFRRPFQVCGLDCLLSLRPARTVSTRSLKIESFARDCHDADASEGSPNLSSSTKEQSQLTQWQPSLRLPSSNRVLGKRVLSPLL